VKNQEGAEAGLAAHTPMIQQYSTLDNTRCVW